MSMFEKDDPKVNPDSPPAMKPKNYHTSVVELMGENPDLDSFVREKEARIEKLEKQNEEMKERIRALEAHLFGTHYCNCERIEEEESK